MEVMIKLHDSQNEIKDGEVLVYDAKTKSLKTVNVKQIVADMLKPYEQEKLELTNKLKSAEQKYHVMLDRFGNILAEFEARLKSYPQKAQPKEE